MRTLWGGWISLLLVVGRLFVPHCADGQTFEGRAHRVIDGDTIHLLRETGQIVRINLYGIDAPEPGQPFGTAATQAVRRAVFRSDLRVVARGRDEDGRPLFVVRVGDHRLNDQLLRDGMAWWDCRQVPSDDRLQRIEREARAAEVGLWAQPDPIPPWTWRDRREEGRH